MAFDDGVKTVSGSVAHTDDAATKVPFVSVKCGIEPTLTGVSEVTETQTGRNLIPFAVDYPNFTQTKNDMTISVLANGKVKFNGTTTASTDFTFYSASTQSEPHLFVKNGTYTFSNIGSASVKMIVSGGSNNGFPYREITNGSYTGSVTDETKPFNYIIFRIASGVTLSDVVIEPMLEFGSTAHDYEPYQTPTQYTTDLGRTIYGGQADIVNGTGTNENNKFTVTSDMSDSIRYIGSGDTAYIQINKTPASNGRWQDLVCSHFTPANIYAGGTQQGIGCYSSQFYIRDSRFTSKQDFLDFLTEQETLGKPLEICYKLATPTDFTFTPITPTPETVGKVNNVYCNTGNTELTYHDNAHGFSEVTVNKTGRNLFDKSKAVFGSINASTGGDINSSTRLRSTWIKLNDSTQYTLSTNDNTLQVYEVYQYTANKTKIRIDRADAQSYTFTTTATTVYMRVIFRHADNSAPTLSELDNTQLELGSTAHAYEPYEVVSKTAYLHKVIYGGQADVVKGTCEPKNPLKLYLARTSHQGINFSLTDEGLLHMEGTNTSDTSSAFSGGNYSTYDACPWKFPPGTYTASSLITADTSKVGSVNILVRTKTDNVNYSYALKDAPKTFTINDDFGAWFWASVLKTETVNCDVGVQLEKGSTASEYVPHFEPFSFPPISMETDEGENTLFANEGDSSITYRKEI